MLRVSRTTTKRLRSTALISAVRVDLPARSSSDFRSVENRNFSNPTLQRSRKKSSLSFSSWISSIYFFLTYKKIISNKVHKIRLLTGALKATRPTASLIGRVVSATIFRYISSGTRLVDAAP